MQTARTSSSSFMLGRHVAASPDVGPDKNVANHGLPVRGAASLIALPLEHLRRNARAGPFFVSSMLSA